MTQIPPPPPMTTRDKVGAYAFGGCLISIVLVPIFFIGWLLSPHPSTPTPAAPLPQSALNVTVAYACAQAMKLNLKDPSSAEFNDGMFNNDTNTVFRNSSGFWQYNSYVIAKNSFNANTKTYFECQAELEPDGQRAVVRNFQIKD